MERILKIEAIDKHEGITFLQLNELCNRVSLEQDGSQPKVRATTGYRTVKGTQVLRSLEITYEVKSGE